MHRAAVGPEVDPVPVDAVGDEWVERQRPCIHQRCAPLRPHGGSGGVERPDAGMVTTMVARGGLGACEGGVGAGEENAGGRRAEQRLAVGLGGLDVPDQAIDVETGEQAMKARVDGDGIGEDAVPDTGSSVLGESAGEGAGVCDEFEGNAEGRSCVWRGGAAGGEIGGRGEYHWVGGGREFALGAVEECAAEADSMS